jgi:hypothetical protein
VSGPDENPYLATIRRLRAESGARLAARNELARKIADAHDERDTMRDERDQARGEATARTTERDGIAFDLDRLLEAVLGAEPGTVSWRNRADIAAAVAAARQLRESSP